MIALPVVQKRKVNTNQTMLTFLGPTFGPPSDSNVYANGEGYKTKGKHFMMENVFHFKERSIN